MIDYSVCLTYNAVMKKLGEEIRALRQELKLTAKDLANKIGVDPTYITYIEKHGKIPSPAVMEKIRAVLGKKVIDYEMLETIYLKTKYPEVCKKFEKGQKDIADEFIQKAGMLLKKVATKEEKKEAKKHFKEARAKLEELVIKFSKTIKQLEEMEKSL
jgi:transcriptional regulator with XRE-family HTH domain